MLIGFEALDEPRTPNDQHLCIAFSNNRAEAQSGTKRS